MSAHKKRKLYCVWKNGKDEIIAIDETADRCAELMGITRQAFYTYVVRPNSVWTIRKSEEEEFMNQVTIIGNLTKDPELRSTSDGTPVCGFTVAVNRKKTANNKEPGADFFNVNAWRGLGENCAKFLAKGRKVCVVGRISLRTWENEGKHGASLEVLADEVEFLTARSAPADVPAGYTAVETDDLPFPT